MSALAPHAIDLSLEVPPRAALEELFARFVSVPESICLELDVRMAGTQLVDHVDASKRSR